MIARSGTSKKKGGGIKNPADVQSGDKPKFMPKCCDIREAGTLRVRSGCDPRCPEENFCKEKIF